MFVCACVYMRRRVRPHEPGPFRPVVFPLLRVLPATLMLEEAVSTRTPFQAPSRKPSTGEVSGARRGVELNHSWPLPRPRIAHRDQNLQPPRRSSWCGWVPMETCCCGLLKIRWGFAKCSRRQVKCPIVPTRAWTPLLSVTQE